MKRRYPKRYRAVTAPASFTPGLRMTRCPFLGLQLRHGHRRVLFVFSWSCLRQWSPGKTRPHTSRERGSRRAHRAWRANPSRLPSRQATVSARANQSRGASCKSPVPQACSAAFLMPKPELNQNPTMSRPLRIPKPQTPLHLYRHLLRESSYLPPPARPFIDKQIKDRFARDRNDVDERSAKRIRQAHHDLRYLRAANAGDMTRMQRVLLRAFGRLGRRRRELMSRVLVRDAPTDTDELARQAADAAAIASENRRIDWLDSWDIDKLRRYANSQVQAGLTNSPRPQIATHQTQPAKVIPAENSWGRPLAPKLYRTKLKKMWAAVADKCMPPLPRKEWETLKAIAEGTVQGGWLPPPRRALARCMSGEGQGGHGWDWQAYAVWPVAFVDRPANRRNKLLTGAVHDNTPTGDPQPIGCHKYTRRTWRRMMSDVWRLTATMEKKPGGQHLDIRWGKTVFQPPPATATPGAMEFFKDFPEPEEAKSGRTRGKQGS